MGEVRQETKAIRVGRGNRGQATAVAASPGWGCGHRHSLPHAPTQF